MQNGHRASGLQRESSARLELGAPGAVEHAAITYLRWAGRSTDAENVEGAATRIRALCAGRAVAREDLHLQLVMDELVAGLSARGARRVA